MAPDPAAAAPAPTADGLAPRRGAGRPSSPVISRDEVIRNAIAMIDEDGLDAFSLRKLARQMGVTSPTLHHHFGDREQVLVLVVRHLLRDLKAPEGARTWQDFALEAAFAYYRVMTEHPHVAPLFATRPWSTSVHHAVVDESVRLLDQGGVPVRLQLLVLRALEIVAIGAGVTSGRLDSAVYGAVGEKYGFLRAAVDADTMDEDQTFAAIARSMITGLTGTIMSLG